MDPISTRISAANSLLSPSAIPHDGGLGRVHPESDDETRFPFQRDRDRIIHTQAFRRLKGKTQVFVVGNGDHFRTRLTHTMEVAQISRDMARTLGLNEDLAECIALAHDLGHTPFGHAGESAMNELMKEFGSSFEHNEQSLRIVTLLEDRTKKYKGLNLNAEVLEGLMKHRTSYDKEQKTELQRAPSLEAQVVNLSDEIAYTAHDTDDGLRSDIIKKDDLMHIPLFAEAHERSHENQTEVRGSIIHMLVMNAYTETERRLTDHNILSLDDVYSAKEELISFSKDMDAKLAALREFLFAHLYQSDEVMHHSKEGMNIIMNLFKAYEKNPPEKVLALRLRTDGTLPEAIKDYIAGMTDQYAERCLRDLR